MASQVDINEGGIVDFDLLNKQHRNPSTGEVLQLEADISPVKWDFDDEHIDPAVAYGLYYIRRWFSGDAAGPYVVKATHQGTTKEVAIRVHNVLPSVNGVYKTDRAEILAAAKE